MSAPTDIRTIIGKNAVDNDGDKVGKVGQVYLDDASEQPVWVTVSTGMFGTKESFAPLYGATVSDDELRLAVSKQQVKDAPSVDADGHLGEDENTALYQHYQGFLGTGNGTSDGTGNGTSNSVDTDSNTDGSVERPTADLNDAGTQGHDTSGPNTDDAMTRSEERLHVGTERVEAGRARLRKYIVTENVTQTVPVSHEEVRIVREPITADNADAALSGADLSEEEHEVTLTAERAVVSKETVPVERVRLATETVTEQAQVDETVRHEEIEQVEGTPAVRPDATTGR